MITLFTIRMVVWLCKLILCIMFMPFYIAWVIVTLPFRLLFGVDEKPRYRPHRCRYYDDWWWY